jgi:hypothetical protein
MAERKKSLKTLSKEEQERMWALQRRRSELARMAYRCRGAMAGQGPVRLTLKSGAEVQGIPTQMSIDKSLEGRPSNLMIYLQGWSFPLDDVIVCQ